MFEFLSTASSQAVHVHYLRRPAGTVRRFHLLLRSRDEKQNL